MIFSANFKKYVSLIKYVILLGFLISTSATAFDDPLPPSWRGQAGTTYQDWSFDTNSNPAIPEEVSNPTGCAYADITVGDFGEGWKSGGFPYVREGFWDLGRQGTIIAEVDNSVASTAVKEISVQVIYLLSPLENPTVNIPDANLIEEQTVQLEPDPPSTWYVHQSLWRINPNPGHEQIIITADYWGSMIDRIVIDTKSDPPGCYVIDFKDLENFSEQWLEEGDDLQYDLYDSNSVDFKDFAIFARDWLQCIPLNGE